MEAIPGLIYLDNRGLITLDEQFNDIKIVDTDASAYFYAQVNCLRNLGVYGHKNS